MRAVWNLYDVSENSDHEMVSIHTPIIYTNVGIQVGMWCCSPQGFNLEKLALRWGNIDAQVNTKSEDHLENQNMFNEQEKTCTKTRESSFHTWNDANMLRWGRKGRKKATRHGGRRKRRRMHVSMPNIPFWEFTSYHVLNIHAMCSIVIHDLRRIVWDLWMV